MNGDEPQFGVVIFLNIEVLCLYNLFGNNFKFQFGFVSLAEINFCFI